MKLGKYLLNQPDVPNIIPADESQFFSDRLVLLNQNIDEDLALLPEELQQWILKEEKAHVLSWDLTLEYNDMKLIDLLAEVLPKGLSKEFKIDTINQYKILQLTEQQVEYRKVISELLLETSKGDHIETVLQRVVTRTKIDTSIATDFSAVTTSYLSGNPSTTINWVISFHLSSRSHAFLEGEWHTVRH